METHFGSRAQRVSSGDGASSLAWIRSDGIGVVILLNRNLRDTLSLGHPLADALNMALDRVVTWPDVDQFGSMGIH